MDVYMAVAGAPTEVDNHADLVAFCACLMIASKEGIRRNIERELRKVCNESYLKSAQWKVDSLVTAVSSKFDIHIGMNCQTTAQRDALMKSSELSLSQI